MLSSLMRDVRHATRSLRRTPAFSLITLTTLTLGIGATSAMFSVFNAVLLRPLPWGDPARAVMIWSRWSAFDKTWVSEGEVLDYRRRMTKVRSIAAWAEGQVNVTGTGEPERLAAAQATANLFDTLSSPMLLGRPFTASEDRPGGPRVAVISYAVWQRRFGGDAGVLGRGIELDGERYRIVGVTRRGFSLPTDYASPERTQVWTPLRIDPMTAEHGSHGLYAVARLAPGATVAQASAELRAIAAAMTREGLYRPEMQFSAFAVSVRDEVVGGVRPAVVAVFGAVGFLLLIACANVANLMLARADARQREIAVRAALGASRGQTVRQLITEGAILALVSGVVGLALCSAAVRGLAWWNPEGIPRLDESRIDISVALFTFAVSAAVAILFSLAPLWRISRADLVQQLRDGSQSSTAARHRFRSVIVVGEMALAIVLVVGAGLMLRSLDALQRIDLGFNPEDVLTFHVSLPDASYPAPETSVRFYRELLARIRAVSGVKHAAAVRALPLAHTIGDFGVTVEGYTAGPGREAKGDWQIVTDDYLEALGERLVRGRPIRASDDERSMLVGLINQEMARAYWPGQDPIGRRFRIGRMPTRPWITIVGIVHDVRHNGVAGRVKEKFYIPHAQWHRSVGPLRSMYVVVRGSGDVLRLAPAIRQAVREIDPRVPIAALRTMDEVVDTALSRPRFTSLLFSMFSALSVLLAAIGTYGVLSYFVTQRTREIGIRLAIGAAPWRVAREVLGRGLALAFCGLALGAAGGVALGRAVRVLLYGIGPADPVSFAAGVLVLLAAALAASYVPARRATMVDPVVALKAE